MNVKYGAEVVSTNVVFALYLYIYCRQHTNGSCCEDTQYTKIKTHGSFVILARGLRHLRGSEDLTDFFLNGSQHQLSCAESKWVHFCLTVKNTA